MILIFRFWLILVFRSQRTMQAAGIAGIRAIAAHAKDDAARQFYTHFNFIPSPTDPYHLFLLLKDVHRMYP